MPHAAASAAVAAIVLAAGRSSRMGHFKLLADIAGEPMVRRSVRAVIASGIGDVVVVTGHEADKVRDALAGLPVRLVHNPRFAEGLSTSLVAGLAALDPEPEGVLVALGDMPQVSSQLIGALVSAFRLDHVVLPVHAGRIGNPILWPRSALAAMRELEGDAGARKLLQRFQDRIIEVSTDDPGIFADVDTPDALSAVRAQLEAAARRSPRPPDPHGGA